MKAPNNSERNSSRSPANKKGGNKGIKAAKDQDRRERAYARGSKRPKDKK